MCKILIIDDEKWIRRGIVAKLSDSGRAFTWIREAADGEGALEVIKNEEPDIVITDIRMPRIDGLQLISTVRDIYPDIYFIIISGYAEFEYAEKAVNMGVSGYILKPISDENLFKAVDNAIDNLNKRKEVKRMINMAGAIQRDNEELLYERFLNQVLNTGNPADMGGLIMETGLFNNIENKLNVLVLIHIDNSNYYKSDFKYQDLDLLKFSIKNMLKELYPDAIIVNNQKDLNQIYCLLFDPQRDDLSSTCAQFVSDAYIKVSKYLDIALTIAVSNIEDHISNELVKQVKAAFDLRLIFGSNKIYRYENIELGQKFELPETELNLLKKCMEAYDSKNILSILNNMFLSENLKSYSGVYLRYLFSEIINILLKVCTNFNIDVEASIDSEVLTGEILNSIENNEEAVSFLYTSIIDTLKAKPISTFDCKNVINKTIAFVNQNYSMDLNVKELARKSAFNSNYFADVFKQLTGKTFTKYLTDVRIKKACDLLKRTDLGIAQISESVGYQDVRYFHRVFKKATGKTPVEFRDFDE